jgi:hypothetical protein
VLDKLFESLYLKVFVNIVIKEKSILVYIEIHSKKGVIDNVQSEFETLEVTEKMIDFIQGYIKESPYFYISILDNSLEQGALPTCKKNDFALYYDISSCEYKCYEKRWTYYTSKAELYTLEKKFSELGVDFIFSPFLIVENFFQDKIKGSLALYALVEENFISLAIFEESKLLYAEHIDIHTKDEDDELFLVANTNDEEDLHLDEQKDGIDLEDIDIDEDDELEDFADIEDLDSIEEIEEFEESKDIEEELLESDTVFDEPDEENFNEDYQRFIAIQSSINRFYKDERYESRFIENIYIADSVSVSSDFKKYLEEEMFFNVYIRHVEIEAELCELAKEELGL